MLAVMVEFSSPEGFKVAATWSDWSKLSCYVESSGKAGSVQPPLVNPPLVNAGLRRDDVPPVISSLVG